MVQDMLDSEYYATHPASQGSYISNDSIAERSPLIITPIPHLTAWFQENLIGKMEQVTKKQRMEDKNKDENDLDVVAKVYYDHYPQQMPPLKLNDIVDIVGVIEREDEAMDNQVDYDDMMLMDAVPPSHLPRIHVVWFAPTLLHDVEQGSNPLNPWTNHTIPLLSKALGVDSKIATALWLTCASNAERDEQSTPKLTPEGMTLGCASLQVFLEDKAHCETFQHTLEATLSSFLPMVVSLKITRETLSSISVPRRQNGRMVPTPLQLPQHSTIILNLAEMEVGKLTQSQVETMQALQQLAHSHRIAYQFEGGVHLNFEANVRVFVIATPATKNLVPCTLQVAAQQGECQPLSPEEYLLLRRALPLYNSVQFPTNVLTCAQEDFVSRRSRARESNALAIPDEKDFHRHLTLTRLIARSRHARDASVDDWKQALQLDDLMTGTR